MRITAFDYDENKECGSEAPLRECGIDVPLRRRAASAQPLEAASWQKILDLVAHLQSDGTDHELWGSIYVDELVLRKPVPFDLIGYLQEERLLKEEWRALTADPATRCDRLSRKMKRRFLPSPKPGVEISVRVEWSDDAPLRDGLPEMHYGFQVRRPGKTDSEDARAKNVAEAERILCEAFGWEYNVRA